MLGFVGCHSSPSIVRGVPSIRVMCISVILVTNSKSSMILRCFRNFSSFIKPNRGTSSSKLSLYVAIRIAPFSVIVSSAGLCCLLLGSSMPQLTQSPSKRIRIFFDPAIGSTYFSILFSSLCSQIIVISSALAGIENNKTSISIGPKRYLMI